MELLKFQQLVSFTFSSTFMALYSSWSGYSFYECVKYKMNVPWQLLKIFKVMVTEQTSQCLKSLINLVRNDICVYKGRNLHATPKIEHATPHILLFQNYPWTS